MSSIVTLSGVAKRYGARVVFEGLDARVEAGETLAVLGPSGCGKSTLLRVAGGLVAPDAGTVDVRGEIGFVFQEPRLMPWLDVEKNVAFAARDASERARVRDAIELVGLGAAAKLLPKALSGGMAQRASLARSLVRKPDVLLLDEPLSALDALLRIELQDHLARAMASSGAAAVLVTHDVDEALYLADRAIVLAGTPATIALEIVVPPELRRARFADRTVLKNRLLEALGVEAPRERDGASVRTELAPIG
jgi:sulfonate transport system ATP-binding protein